MRALRLLCLALPAGAVRAWDARTAGPASRRRLLRRLVVTAGGAVVAVPSPRPRDAAAATAPLLDRSRLPGAADPSTELPAGLLEARLTENLLSAPPYGLEAPDVAYPAWLAGTWRVAATTREVLGPCGPALFGGEAALARARAEVGTTLPYGARFVPLYDCDGDSGGAAEAADGGAAAAGTITCTPFGCAADREFNVRSLAAAAMGARSVVRVDRATPNEFSCVLATGPAPTGAAATTTAPPPPPSLLRVDLLTLRRRQERVSDARFDCAEVVREVAAPLQDEAGGAAPRAPVLPLLREVETVSLYTHRPELRQVTCRQRTATFLLPSQQSAAAMRLWEAARGRPVDVRFYDVVYTRTST